MRLLTMILVTLLTSLAACGGGGDTAPDATSIPVDCKARPDACK